MLHSFGPQRQHLIEATTFFVAFHIRNRSQPSLVLYSERCSPSCPTVVRRPSAPQLIQHGRAAVVQLQHQPCLVELARQLPIHVRQYEQRVVQHTREVGSEPRLLRQLGELVVSSSTDLLGVGPHRPSFPERMPDDVDEGLVDVSFSSRCHPIRFALFRTKRSRRNGTRLPHQAASRRHRRNERPSRRPPGRSRGARARRLAR